MGAWGAGPFDNDDAADWAGELEDAEPDERPAMIRAALSDAADEPDYLKIAVGEIAIAAAAVVVVADESEWYELWEESGKLETVLAALAPIREAFDG